MPQISIDASACSKDGLCAMACTTAVFEQREKGTIPEIVAPERCFGCGHCVAVCRQGAISHSDYPGDVVHPVRTENRPSYDQVIELVRSRRSQRLFREKEVEHEVIAKVLDAARFAPSGHNEQSTEFIVVQNRETIGRIAASTAAYLGKLARQFESPVGRTVMRFILGRRGAAYLGELAPELGHLASLFDSGTDWIVREPPALVLFCADSAGGSFAGVNANLALQNASLAAEALGLGCFYAGFVVLACDRDSSIGELVSLPSTHRVYGALAMGYPQLKYLNWPERKPAKVTWA